jgi:hypothetical protein
MDWMSRLPKMGPRRSPVPRTATSTMARPRSSARITWLGDSNRTQGRSRATGDSRNLVPAAASPGKCTRVGRCKRWQSRSRAARSRPLPCSVRRTSDFVPSDPRHFRARRRTLRRGYCHGELERIRPCGPPLSCGALCPVPPRHTHPGKRSLRAGPRAPPQVPSSGEVLMENLFQLGVRNTDLSAPDGRHASNDGVLERISKRVSTDHSCRGHDNNVLLASRRNVYLRLRGAYRPHPVRRCHESARFSDRLAWNRRSANSHESSIFTMQRARMLVPVDPARSA